MYESNVWLDIRNEQQLRKRLSKERGRVARPLHID